MLISELIQQLVRIQQEHGDLPVVLDDGECSCGRLLNDAMPKHFTVATGMREGDVIDGILQFEDDGIKRVKVG